MKIAFLSNENPQNKIARSGVPFSIFLQLSKANEVVWVKTDVNFWWGRLLKFGVRIFKGIMRKFNYNMLHIPLEQWVNAKAIERVLNKIDFDCIFTMGSVVAYINTDKPIFCRADAIIQSFPDYYIYNVPKFARRWADSMERKALHKYTIFFIPSQWILDEIHKYNINEPDDKFVLVETGANLDANYVKLKNHVYSKDEPLNMFMCGYDVMRKGLEVAFDACKILNYTYGIKAYITVVGGKPSEEMISSGLVKYKGMKNKNIQKEYDEFYEEFSQADLFIFPTKAECHGIVNCEAAAYGLPIFSNNTGGVSNYCIDGYNGRCLPIESTGREYADAIYEAITSGAMINYSKNSRALFESKLNWDTWSQKVLPLMESIVISKM